MLIIIWGVAAAGLFIIGKWDKPLKVERWGHLCIFAGAVMERCAVLHLTAGGRGASCLYWSVIGGCLLLACVTDMAICQVYNFTWWPALAAAVLLWHGSHSISFSSLLFFFLVQFILFRRMYGTADCYAFCLCAAVLAARGLNAGHFLIHMLLAYVLLLPVQIFKHNINNKGNLKTPVAFLPYITAAFWLTVICFGK